MKLIVKWQKRSSDQRTFIDYTEVKADTKEVRLSILKTYLGRGVRVLSIAVRDRESV